MRPTTTVPRRARGDGSTAAALVSRREPPSSPHLRTLHLHQPRLASLLATVQPAIERTAASPAEIYTARRQLADHLRTSATPKSCRRRSLAHLSRPPASCCLACRRPVLTHASFPRRFAPSSIQPSSDRPATVPPVKDGREWPCSRAVRACPLITELAWPPVATLSEADADSQLPTSLAAHRPSLTSRKTSTSTCSTVS
jgi:hypothetical protein